LRRSARDDGAPSEPSERNAVVLNTAITAIIVMTNDRVFSVSPSSHVVDAAANCAIQLLLVLRPENIA
jgi:hypothetical protein